VATLLPAAAPASFRTGANPRLVSAGLGSLDDGSCRDDTSTFAGCLANSAGLLATTFGGSGDASRVASSSTVVVRGNSIST
jgi:hypothetical protein